eukprot:jgi/Mesvir1/11175/Mv16995-RA.1
MGDYHIQHSVLPGSDPTTTPYNPPPSAPNQAFAAAQQPPQQGSKSVFVQPAGAPQQQYYGAPQQGGMYGQPQPGQMQQPVYYPQQQQPGTFYPQPPGGYVQPPTQGFPPQQQTTMVVTTTMAPTMVTLSPWQTSLCGCCTESEGGGCGHFCEAYFCTCWMFGKNRQIVAGTDRCCACFLYAITWPLLALLILLAATLVVFTLGLALFCIPACIPCCIACGGVYPAGNRATMRERLGLPGSYCDDFMAHCCCAMCAVSQESRELKKRGLCVPGAVMYPDRRTTLSPPASQVMMVSSPQKF